MVARPDPIKPDTYRVPAPSNTHLDRLYDGARTPKVDGVPGAADNGTARPCGDGGCWGKGTEREKDSGGKTKTFHKTVHGSLTVSVKEG